MVVVAAIRFAAILWRLRLPASGFPLKTPDAYGKKRRYA
jgi:hypothetical protein